TRTAHFVSPETGITVDSTQVDTINPPTDTSDRVQLEVETVCRTGEVRFIDATRRGSSRLTGGWTQTKDPGTAPSGTCTVQHAWPHNRENPPFRFWVKRPNRGGYNVIFSPGARHVAIQLATAVPDGLTCKAPIPAPIIYPESVGDTLPSPPVTLSRRDLQRDRPFTVRLSGSAGPRNEYWLQAPPGGNTTYRITWRGSITFKPVGCTHYEFSTTAVHVLH